MKSIKLLLIPILNVVFTAQLWAQTFTIDGIKYNILSETDKTVEAIQGTQIPLNGHVEFPATVTYHNIQYSVVAIGTYIFSGYENLKSIDLRNIKSVGHGALADCRNLTIVTNYDKLEYIGGDAFQNTAWYKNLPDGICYIGNVLYKYKGIIPPNTHIKVRDDIKTIAPDAFHSRTEEYVGLTSIDLNNVTQIGEYAFAVCTGLTSINLKNVKDIDSETFRHCKGLESVDLRNAKSIGSIAFGDCSSLTTIDLKNVEKIDFRAFEYCSSLKDIHLKYVKEIGVAAFDQCNQLSVITTCTSLPPHISDGTFTNDTYNKAYLKIPIGNLSNYNTSTLWSKFKHIEEYVPIVYPLNLTCNNGGTILVNAAEVKDGEFTQEFNQGEEVDLTFIPNKDYKLASLTINNKDVTHEIIKNKYSVNINALTNAKVTFQRVSITLNDATDKYMETEDMNLESISYIRNFRNNKWQALYIPFAMNYEDWKDHFDVAYLNDVHQYDDDDNGTIDRTQLEIIRITQGGTEANMPYLIRAKEMGIKTITLSNRLLKATASNSIDCSSTRTLFTFVGTYLGMSGQDMYDNHYFGMGGGKLVNVESPNIDLKPFRWYLSVTDRNGQPYRNIKKIDIIEKGEITGIRQELKVQKFFNVYDINGRIVKKHTDNYKGLQHGIYIVQGKKIIL